MNPTITLTFTEQELNLIFSKLVEAPFKEVINVINSIQNQVNEQNKQPTITPIQESTDLD